MLKQAGIEVAVVPANIDEDADKAGDPHPRALAQSLAIRKAIAVSQACDGWVIGSDSVASVGARHFDKPGDRAEAAEHLRFFAGRTIELTSAAALARDGRTDWSFSDTARLDVRNLSEAFIETYLGSEWPAIGHCAGAFRLEGIGVQLFERIEGSYFTILGMPLLPLLSALRARQVIAS
jgi:septum formation protein